MKTNEAPEKIYLYSSDRAGEEYEAEWGDKPWGEDCVEYTRTDAFIEKACDAYCKVCKMSNCRSNECKWVSNFKEHLETI